MRLLLAMLHRGSLRNAALFAAALLIAIPFAAQSDVPFRETLTVVRYLVDVRVTDSAGRAITDMTAEEFSVKIAERPVHVESATWIPSSESGATVRVPANRDGAWRTEEEPPGRLIVLFIQTDFGRAAPRIMGQLKFNPIADEIIAMLEPNDRVAVLQHDSHLKMRLDFSLDREAVRQAVRDSIRIERLPMPERAIGPSLVRNLDYEEMKRSSSSDRSLLLVAEALRKLDGTKLIILAGWGLGDLLNGRVRMSPGWREAMAVLHRDKVPIISVSTGLPGGQLSRGLRASSVATGGAYAGSTHDFPEQTVIRVAGALAGYYELVLRSDERLDPGQQPVTVQSTRRGTYVFAPPSVIVNPPSGGEEFALEYQSSRKREETPEHQKAREVFSAAMLRLRNGDSSGVHEMLSEVIALDPEHALAWFERGMLEGGEGNFDNALKDLRRYIELEPRGKHAPDVREMLRSFSRDP